ncbi:MAG: hypothetical protein ACRDP1_08195, partial [Nocardioidaceae bacterium]
RPGPDRGRSPVDLDPVGTETQNWGAARLRMARLVQQPAREPSAGVGVVGVVAADLDAAAGGGTADGVDTVEVARIRRIVGDLAEAAGGRPDVGAQVVEAGWAVGAAGA